MIILICSEARLEDSVWELWYRGKEPIGWGMARGGFQDGRGLKNIHLTEMLPGTGIVALPVHLLGDFFEEWFGFICMVPKEHLGFKCMVSTDTSDGFIWFSAHLVATSSGRSSLLPWSR